MKLGKISQFVSFVVSCSASIRISFLQSRLCKYTVGVFVLGLLSVSLLSSPISPVDAATTVGVSNTTIVSQGLVGYWTFDGKNMTNATATDISGNGNNGTLVNTTNAVSASIGKLGQSLTFDGINDYVLTGLTSHYNQTTISAWIYPRSLGEGNLGRIIDKRENGGVETLYFALNGNNKLIFGRKFSTSLIGNWLTLDNSITLGTWNHVIVTFDESSSTNKPVFYINGVLASSTTAYNPTGTATTNTDRYIIGNRGDTTRTFDGKIDDVRIYNRIVTPTEVQTLYKAGGGVKVTDTEIKTFITTPGASTWTVPTGVTKIKVEAIGAGGGGGSGTGSGGGGGAYAVKRDISVTPGSTISVNVGTGGAVATAGTDTTFNTSVVVAKGGAAGINGSAASTSGGKAASSTPTIGAFSGGNGGGNDTSYNSGGAGGGAASYLGAGGNSGGNGSAKGGAGGGGSGGGSAGGNSVIGGALGGGNDLGVGGGTPPAGNGSNGGSGVGHSAGGGAGGFSNFNSSSL